MFLKPVATYTDDEKDAVLRAKLLTDFLFFTRHFFKVIYGKRFVLSHHHTRVADKLVEVARGDCKRLIINIPPRYSKTLLAVHMFLAWTLANNAASRSIHISYSDDLALDNSAAVRDIIKTEDYQRMFNVRIRADSDSKKKWYTEENGGLYAVASGGAITGFGAGAIERIRTGTGSPADGFAGLILIDDPVKPDDAFSDTILKGINRRYTNTIASRVNSPEETPIVLIMQRLHENDLSGFLIGGGSGEEWDHLCIPVINEDGEALWHDKHDIARLRQMEAADPYTFAGQYMQRPSPLGGGMFKDEWWRYYKVLPEILWRSIYADTAQKVKEYNDWSVLQCWGKSVEGKAVLIDQLRGKWEAPELLKKSKAFWNKHRVEQGCGTLRAMKIEDKASGTGLIQQLRAESIPVVAVQRGTDKRVRACDASPWVESGHVLIPEDEPWINDYTHEFSAFPNGANDDQIDPTMDAIADMLQCADMSFIPSNVVCKAISSGSGHYLGDDPLICGVYVAKNQDEISYIHFRRGKDAVSEKTYSIGWVKSSNPQQLSEVLAKVINDHKPDATFIGEAGAGVVTDRLDVLGYNVVRVNLYGDPVAPMQYKDKLSEMYWAMRLWMMDDGSVTNNMTLEHELVSIEYTHKNNDQLLIEKGSEWCTAIALTFAYHVPQRFAPRGELDAAIGARSNAYSNDYDPLDEM